MSKYNLTDLYEEMRPKDREFEDAKEKERLEKHPERDKIKAVQAMMAKEKASKNEASMLNITDPSNPKLTSFDAMITGALSKAYPSAEMDDLKAFVRQLKDNADAGRVKLDGLDVGEEFEQFAMDNNIPLKDPVGGLREHFNRFK